MPDIRLQALPRATNLDQALAVGGESIYDLLDRVYFMGASILLEWGVTIAH